MLFDTSTNKTNLLCNPKCLSNLLCTGIVQNRQHEWEQGWDAQSTETGAVLNVCERKPDAVWSVNRRESDTNTDGAWAVEHVVAPGEGACSCPERSCSVCVK